jgi:hypothetical protein
MNQRRRLGPVKGPLLVAADLELQARRLRKTAAAWCAAGSPPDVTVGGVTQTITGLSYTDLIDDAAELERDAAKLRATYAN